MIDNDLLADSASPSNKNIKEPWRDMPGTMDPADKVAVQKRGKSLRMTDAEIAAAIKLAKEINEGLIEEVVEVNGEWRTILVVTSSINIPDVLIEADEHFSAPGGMLSVVGGDPNLHYCWIAPKSADQVSAAYQNGYRPVSNLRSSDRMYNRRKVEGGDKPVIACGDLDLYACPRSQVERRVLREQNQRDREYRELIGGEGDDMQLLKAWADDQGLVVRTDGRHSGGSSSDDSDKIDRQGNQLSRAAAEAYQLAKQFQAERATPEERAQSFFGQISYKPGQHEKIFSSK